MFRFLLFFQNLYSINAFNGLSVYLCYYVRVNVFSFVLSFI